MSAIRKLTAHIQYAFDDETKNRVRLNLLRKSDAYLREVGVSRTLLERGVDAWPWSADADPGRIKVA